MESNLKISVENFKSFGKKQTFTLKPLTLIYGKNSVGKSSLMHALVYVHHLLSEDFRSHDIDEVEITDAKISLGGFGNLIHQKDISKTMKFSFSFDLADMLVNSDFDMYLDRSKSLLMYLIRDYSMAKECVELLNKINKEFNEDTLEDYMRKSANSKHYDHIINRIALDTGEYYDEVLFGMLVMQQGVYEKFLLNIFGITEDDLNLVAEESSRIKSNMGGNEKVIINTYKKLLKNIQNNSIFKDFDSENVTINIEIASDGLQQFELYLGESLILCTKSNHHITSLDHSLFYNLFSTILSGMKNKDKILNLITTEAIISRYTPRHFFSDIPSLISGASFINSVSLSESQREEINILRYSQTVTGQIFKDNFERGLFDFVFSFVKGITNCLKDTLQYQYIGPLRKYPERKDFFKLIKPKLIEYNKAWDSIWSDDCIKDTNEWFSSEIMGDRYKVEILEWKSNQKIDQIYELAFYDKITKTYVNSQEMGLGISQFLPIIIMSNFQFSQVKGNLRILVEQPELHLHPSLQAEIADFLINLGTAGDGCIVETHSEHILLRVMKRIRETAEGKLKSKKLHITPEDVAILYIDADEKRGTYITELELSEDGNLLDPWPGGFFEEGFEERFF
jgi:predicted ATPase